MSCSQVVVYNSMSSPKHRENNDLTTRHNKRKYNSMSSPKHRENNDLTTRHNKRKYNSMEMTLSYIYVCYVL
jgi:hypothetical protein